jgi:hypothetical protein
MLISKKKFIALENDLQAALQAASEERNMRLEAEARFVDARREVNGLHGTVGELASRLADARLARQDAIDSNVEAVRQGTDALASLAPFARRVLERINVVTRLLPTDQEAGHGGIMVSTIRDVLADLDTEATALLEQGENAEQLQSEIQMHDAKQLFHDVLITIGSTGLLDDNGNDAGCSPE